MENIRNTKLKYWLGLILLSTVIIIVLWSKQTLKIEITLDVDAPPIPTFETPVDYVAWYRSRNFEDGSPCGVDVYPSLFKDELNDFFKPNVELNKALNKASVGIWSEQEIPDLTQYLEKLEPYLLEYTNGKDIYSIQWLCNATGLWDGPHPNYLVSRILGKALLANAWKKISPQKHHPDELINAIETNFQHASHIQKSAGTVAFLMNLGIRSYNYRAIQRGFQTSYLSNEHASHILDILHGRDQPANIVEAYRGDWAGMLDMIQRLFPNGKFSNVAAKTLDVDEFLLGGLFLPKPQKTVAKINEWFQTAINLITPSCTMAVYHDLHKHDLTKQNVSGRNNLLSLYLPTFSKVYSFCIAIETKRRGTILLVALHKYFYEKGHWPISLDDVLLLSPETRLDPYREKEFIYMLRDGKPWLYSVGLDGLDNKGNHDPRAMTSNRKVGYDYVFMPIPDNP